MKYEPPYSIYCDWGMHDELGDTVELDEAMTFRALDRLEQWKNKFGLTFDYYLFDCFWYDQSKGYMEFKKPHWPNGPDKAFERIRGLGMAPGLWYSTSGSWFNVEDWNPSRGTDDWHHSMIEGPYANRLEEAWMHAVNNWGVRFFKLDFVNLATRTAQSDLGHDETYRRAVKRLKAILGRVKQACPELRVLVHCGWHRVKWDQRTGSGPSPIHDPAWLEVLDKMFAGDPHPCDIPRSDLVRCNDLFQDQQMWKVNRAGMPLEHLDDHGVMIGNTNTCFYRGRHGLRRSHLAQLARGCRRDMYYGDPTLAHDDDVKGMGKTRKLFFDAYGRNLPTVFVGEGEPGLAPWHGFLTGGGDRGLAYLVNGTFAPRRVELAVPGAFDARVLFFDGPNRPPVSVSPDQLTLDLLPEQMVLVGLGEYAHEAWDLGPSTDSPQMLSCRPLPASFRGSGDWDLEAEIPDCLNQGEELMVVAEALDGPPNASLSSPPYRFGKQATRKSKDMEPLSQKLLCIEAFENQRPLAWRKQIPNVPVFSGVSWVVRIFPACSGVCSVLVAQNFESHRRIRARAYAVTFAQ
jgi:hypothetical protein